MVERSEGLADWTQYHIQEIQGIRLHVAHISNRLSNQSTQLGHFSHLDSHYYNRSLKYKSSIKLCFYVGTIQRIYLCSDDICSVSTLMLGLIHVEFFNVIMFVLTLTDSLCCAWFVYLFLCWCIYQERKGLALLIGPNWIGSTWRRRQDSVSQTLCFK
jgi:hypothetical protein